MADTERLLDEIQAAREVGREALAAATEARDPEMIDGIRMARELRTLTDRRAATDAGYRAAVDEAWRWRCSQIDPLVERSAAIVERLKGWHRAMHDLGMAARTQTLPFNITVRISKPRSRVTVVDRAAFEAWVEAHSANPQVKTFVRTVTHDPEVKPDVRVVNAAMKAGVLGPKESGVIFEGEVVPGLAVVGGVDVSVVDGAVVDVPVVAQTGRRILTDDRSDDELADEAEHYTYTEGPDGTTLKVPREIEP